MKTKINYKILLAVALCCAFTACEDFLDKEPLSEVSPEAYFTDATHLLAYADDMYHRILPDNAGNSYGFYATDKGTDNQIAPTAPDMFYSGQWKVPQSGGNWAFEIIYRLNFFFANVDPRFGDDSSGSKNTISGDLQTIRHYIGEMYCLRAIEYFNRYKKLGDFPIITEPLPDDGKVLTEAAKRAPRNEVARFILSDLDKAIDLMSGKTLSTTRFNKDVAILLKSRVALHEATWLKYFKGTAFVPNGDGWPGKAKDYNAGYQYPDGSIENEINFFLDQAMAASKEIAEKYKANLTENTGVLQQSKNDPANPYFDMFATVDLSSVPEVLMWRQYALGVKTHAIPLAANQGNWGVGVTRAFVQNFLMADGKPVYSHGTYADGDGYYMGDKTIAAVRENRDSRLSLFLKEPDQINIFEGKSPIGSITYVEPIPDITTGTEQVAYTTGYALRKGGSFDVAQFSDMNRCFTGLALYRTAEALLNYMEASYERNGTLDAQAREYWKLLRRRANVSEDIDATIAATDMNKEAENDWGAYSAGNILADATLYNIRRERRCEFITEGLRLMDLYRWRSLDQMITKPYHPEGFHLWNTPMENWYNNLISDGSGKANVSPVSDGEYLRPYRKTSTQRGYNGFTWSMAHYLDPIAVKQLKLTAPDGETVADSPIYQNPHWPLEADKPAEK